MDTTTIVKDSANDHKRSGYEDKDYDPWFYETCKMVNVACDKFWTKTPERIRLNELYYKLRVDRYGF